MSELESFTIAIAERQTCIDAQRQCITAQETLVAEQRQAIAGQAAFIAELKECIRLHEREIADAGLWWHVKCWMRAIGRSR